VCQYCFSESPCDHGAGKSPSSACTCSLAGPSKCPGCGCECPPWYWGLGFAGPSSLRSFFGVGDDENPGFSQYPASKAKLVEAAREQLQDAEADMADVGWLSGNLPDATYQDPGEVFAALTPVVACRGKDSSALVTALPMSAVASGTRLVVGPDQLAVLVASDGRPLDSFGPGEYTLSRDGAPRAAAESRPSAAGFLKSVISAKPVFASTQGIRTPVDHPGRTRAGESVSVRGSVTVSVGSLPEFITKLGSRPRGLSATEGATEVTRILGAVLDQALSSHDFAELTGPGALLEAAVRSGAAQAGLRVSAVAFDPVTRVSVTDQLTAVQEMQRKAFANMPPEMQARMQAQMAKAMERSQASRGMGSAGPSAGAGPGATPPRPPAPAAARACPSCQAPNPPESKFCRNCGQPLLAKRSCPGCGKDVEPGVKFCGSCGARLV
jgi:membrane protease subunit (stomatin/prohibitin family)